MMSILDPRFWLACIITVALSAGAGYLKGGKDERAAAEHAQLKAVITAQETGNELQRLQNRSTTDYLARVRNQQEKAHALPKIRLPRDCAVPAVAGRVLNDAERVHTDAGTGPGTGSAGQVVDSTCAAELDIAKRNYAEVCVPNAEQLTELQHRWNEVRAQVNKSTSH